VAIYAATLKAFLFLYGKENSSKRFWDVLAPKLKPKPSAHPKQGPALSLPREDLVWFELLGGAGTWVEGMGRPPLWVCLVANDIAAQVFALAPAYWIEMYGSYLVEALYKSTCRDTFVPSSEHAQCLEFLVETARSKSRRVTTRLESSLALHALRWDKSDLLRTSEAQFVGTSVPLQTWKKFTNGLKIGNTQLKDRIQTGLFLFLCSLQNSHFQ
jgi:hypothetical protein